MKTRKNIKTFWTNDFTKAFVEKFQVNDFTDFEPEKDFFEIREIKHKFANTIAKIEKEFNFTFEEGDSVEIFSSPQDFLTIKFANHIDFITGQSEDISRFMFAFIIDKQEIVNEMVENLIETQNNKNEIEKLFFDKEKNVVVEFDMLKTIKLF